MSVNTTVARMRSGSTRSPNLGYEPFDLTQSGVGIAQMRGFLRPFELDVPRSWDVRRKVVAVTNIRDEVAVFDA